MTTLNIMPKRFVRRADSGVIPITEWLGAMATTFEALKAAPWAEAASDILLTSLPVNEPVKFLAADDRYDAFRQSGNYFIAGPSGDTAVSPDAAAVRALNVNDVSLVVPGPDYCAFVRNDGTALVARYATSLFAPAVDVSALSNVSHIAFTGSIGAGPTPLGYAVHRDGAVSATGNGSAPPEFALHRVTSARSGLRYGGSTVPLLVFYDDIP